MNDRIITRMKSKNFRGCIKAVCLFLVFLFLLYALSGVFFPSENATSNNPNARAYGFRAEKENSIDIAGVGNSDLYSSLIPLEIWNSYGYPCFISATIKQKIFQTYDLTKELLKTQNPKLLIIETDVLYDGSAVKNSADEQSDDRELSEKSTLKAQITQWFQTDLTTFMDGVTDDNFSVLLEKDLPIFKFHDRWKKLTAKDFSNIFSPRKWKCTEKGYYYSNKIKGTKSTNLHMTPSDETDEIGTYTLYILDKIVALCRENHTEILFVEMPTTKSWNYSRHNAVAAYAEEHDINFVDMNLLCDEIGLDWSQDTRDGGNHLNHNGALKVTEYLGKYISAHYSDLLTDKRSDPDYASWSEDYEKYTQNSLQNT